MGRKKSKPNWLEPGQDAGRTEYLGTYAHVAAAQNASDESSMFVEMGSLIPEAEGGLARSQDPDELLQDPPKRVAFAADRVQIFEQIPPEIEFVTEAFQDTANFDDKKALSNHEQAAEDLPPAEETPILRFNCDPRREANDGVTAKILLRQFTLDASFRLESTIPKTMDRENERPRLPFKIRTSEGAIELMQLCLNLASPARDQLDQDQGHVMVETKNIGKAVEYGLLVLSIDNWKENTKAEANYSVALSLSDYAFDICSPRVLPVRASRKSKSYETAVSLQLAFVELFPKFSTMFPLAKQTNDNHTITAKQVYAWVDNMQIKAHLNKKPPPGLISASEESSESINIAGLLPTLRPYQEAAVKWMLERERASGPNLSRQGGEEWELAWIMVDAECNKREAKWSICFLPDYVRHLPQKQSQKNSRHQFLFCPFTNWLARSVGEARDMSMRTSMHPRDRTAHNNVALGGILAESMGLGKTVELLACILANPDPCYKETKIDQSSSLSTSSSSLSTHLPAAVASVMEDMHQQVSPVTLGKDRKHTGSNKRQRVEASVSESQMPRTGCKSQALISAVLGVGNVSTSDSSISASGNDSSATIPPSNMEERWCDDEDCELGSCVCGVKIYIFPSPEKDSIVICEECQDPMHWTCAAFGAERDCLPSMSKGVIYKKERGEDSFWCRFCPPAYCPCCATNRTANRKDDKFRSRATVIVTPPAILNQWKHEISRHTTGNLRVVVYTGVKNLCNQQQQKRGGNESFQFVHPRWLADADIVLVTFDALHRDLGHSDSNPFAGNGRSSLRKRKVYRVVPSPLSSISWWRVCLDEAQRVETPTAGSAQMALKLHTQHRWCVTGTPIGKGKLEDLFGLLLFLRSTPPFNNKDWFRVCLTSFEGDTYMEKRLKHLLSTVFWRSTKALQSVVTEMGVPPQIEKRRLLKFSSVERHFYTCQLEETMQVICALSNEQKVSRKRGKGDKSLDLLDCQLGKLRAACCHPQVGSSGLVLGKKSRSQGPEGGVKVLSMDQVLDQLIDDQRTKCEEALRVALFHSNPMATITRLKVEARRASPSLTPTICQSDDYLIAQSCKLYEDAIRLADENAEPSLVTEEVFLSGSDGFRSSSKSVRGGSVFLGWNLQSPQNANGSGETCEQLWAAFEYKGQGKKMREIRVRSCPLPVDLHASQSGSSCNLRHPKRCVFQVANAAVGGEFVDVLSFELPRHAAGQDHDHDWIAHRGLWVYNSKRWRIVVESFYFGDALSHYTKLEYCGIQVALYEPSIGFDSLPRLHTLHNAVISFRHLQSVQTSKISDAKISPNSDDLPLTRRGKIETVEDYLQLSKLQIEERVQSLEQEYAKIETYHLEYAKKVRGERARRLKDLISTRKSLDFNLLRLQQKKDKNAGFWDVAWWDDIVEAVQREGSPDDQYSLCEAVQEAVDGCDTYEDNFDLYKSDKPKAFPKFVDINGLAVAMKMRFSEFLQKMQHGKYNECIDSVFSLSPNPSHREVLENQTCGVCKADWGRTGPVCGHCIVGDKLRVLDLASQKLARYVLRAIWTWSKNGRSGVRNSAIVKEKVRSASKFFDVMEVSGKEVRAASQFWMSHLTLLNIMDELNSTKSAMRLVYDEKDVEKLTQDEKNAVLYPLDVCDKYDEHEKKQASALANLRQLKSTLQYLKNQANKTETCIICRDGFSEERVLLACGHSFHIKCMKWLQEKQKNPIYVCCPFRCKTRTKCSDVLIATNRRSDDGTKVARSIKGDFGTKVNALVGDILAVSDRGEKSVVFSMWEDMLDIVQEALTANEVKLVRASSRSKIGESSRQFRSSDCFVLLLNVKNGAEGLNLTEATHVFMVEPLLNCGLDSQAIARIHRIGQTRHTFVHRYLIEDTIEVRIDEYRQQHQEDQLEDAIVDSRKCAIHAGGIDGGFSSREELMAMLSAGLPDGMS